MAEGPGTEIANGALASAGLYDGERITKAAELVQQVSDGDIETIRIVFPDQHGLLRGKTITSRKLLSVFKSGLGIPSTLLLKDTAHKTVFDVWEQDNAIDGLSFNGAGDLLLVPDPNTFTPLPWSQHSAILICDVAHRTGNLISFSSRSVLQKAVDALASEGYSAMFGLEVEFQVFNRLDDALEHGHSTMPPAAIKTANITQGWQYLTETRYAEVEELLDTLRRTAESMGLAPCSMEIEMGPSQFEFTFEPSGPVQQADRFVLFRTMVKEVCHARGLHASFMAKPKLPNAAANGWHIHQSLQDLETGENVFTPSAQDELTLEASAWIAGLLEHAEACCLLTTPTVNGYKRYTPFQLAPNRIQWGTDNRGAMIRALLYPQDDASRIENRAPDTTANPYFAFSAQLLAGLDGLQRKAKAPAMTHTPYDDEAKKLPVSLNEAIDVFEASTLFRESLGEDFVAYLVTIKRSEWQRYLMTISEWEQAEYFNLF